MMLTPDSDHIKKVGNDEEPDEKDVEVEFEHLEEFLDGSIPCRVCIGRITAKEKKQVLFWQLTGGDSMITPDVDKANFTWAKVAVSVSIEGVFEGPLARDEAGSQLNDCSRASGEVKVIIPVLVNHKRIEAKDPFLLHRALPPKKEEKKRKVEKAVNASDSWKKKLAQADRDPQTNVKKARAKA
jgi:hypothetical protein